jgi:hypothetical protein
MTNDPRGAVVRPEIPPAMTPEEKACHEELLRVNMEAEQALREVVKGLEAARLRYEERLYGRRNG